MISRETWKKLTVLGLLMATASSLLRYNVFPDSKPRFGHWFWIGIFGAVLSFVGQMATRKTRD
jgi:hypothetical protein